ncbi:GDP-L-fucose synthase family protein [Paludibacterium paludis]|uniref:GDP-L-fucose synthase n=1 Tax=Paludibacterium paludis TaxID=1225769 RepID=A0A918P2C8_9NEIS|nr:GDP-L-fucose synthase [Paludibacterium paludis]GGY15645.1 GDP-L-fucose synthase [Paludibacterium paludis]
MNAIPREARIYIAGHRGMVGGAIVRELQRQGYHNLITRTHEELDLTRQADVEAFFAAERPQYVFLAAAKVGGIHANNVYRADFISQNLMIQTNVINAAWQNDVERLLFLGSSCIYPKECPQPIKESYLLTGPLESTNQPYALAKIAGIEMCWSFNRQHGTRYLAVMPTNLYGPGDNYHPENSHVIPALIRKAHEAKLRGDASMTVWGSGRPMREFLYSEDMAAACVYLMNLPEAEYRTLLTDETPPLVNIGVGHDMTIAELAQAIARVVGFEGELVFDASKPDGTMRKLLDVGKLAAYGWKATMPFETGIAISYEDFLKRESSRPASH